MKLKIPGLPPAVNQIVVHMLTVFLVAFGAQLVAGATGAASISSLLALLTAAAAAGGVAVLHLAIGLVPTASSVATPATKTYSVTVTQVKSAGYQVAVSVAVTFVTILGSQLAGGAVHATSLPSVVAVILAAISAAVAAVVQLLVGLVPAPPVAV